MATRKLDGLLTIALALLAALSAYYSTIEGLKVELAGKAEEAFVANLDKRLSNLEIRLTENFASRNDILQLRHELIDRLYRIEGRLNRIEIAGRQSSETGNPIEATPKEATIEAKCEK